MEGITPLHLVLVLVIALIVIGPGKLPGVGKALGESIREFRKATTDIREAVSLQAPPASSGVVTADPPEPVVDPKV
jgi:sec-independent protein translocase protein TatA